MRDYIITRDSSDYLQHHGIKGQKWGVRRFENEDGTLTPEGKERYRYSAEEYEKAGDKRLKKYNDATSKYSQDECYDYLSDEPRMGKLIKEIRSATKLADDKYSVSYDELKKAKKASNSIFNREKHQTMYKNAELENAKAYYDWAKVFDNVTQKNINEMFKPEERELATACIFWAFFE